MSESDIVEQLRSPASDDEWMELMAQRIEAANEITRLRADVTDLTIEVKELAGEVDFQKDKVKSHGEQVARLRALNAELVEALKMARPLIGYAGYYPTIIAQVDAAIAKAGKDMKDE